MANLKAWIETVRRKNGKVRGFRVRYRDSAGTVQSEPGVFEDKTDAKDLKDGVNQRLLDGRLGRTSPNATTLDAFNRWMAECRAGVASKKGIVIKEQTLKTYTSHLQELLKTAPKLINLDEKFLMDWKVKLAGRGDMPWTIAGKLRDARTFLGWCKRRKFIGNDPFENIGITAPIAKPRYYDDAELDALETAAKGDSFHLALRLGYKCGLRRGEVLRADKSDIRWLPNGTGELTVWANESKNGENRTVPLPPLVMELLGSRGPGELYGSWSKEKFEYHWWKLKAKAGIKEAGMRYANREYKWALKNMGAKDDEQARFHDTRHTFCRIFLETGAGDISDLAKITGHKSLDILYKVYSHFQTKKLHEAMAIMEARPIFRGATVGQMGQKPDILGLPETLTDINPIIDLMNKQSEK